jgi:hypothetical protein
MVSGMTDSAERNDLSIALSLAVGAIVLGSFLPWAHSLLSSTNGTDGRGNLTLLLGGAAGALVARWRWEGGGRRGFMTASLALCAAASGVLLVEVVQVTRLAAQPQSGLFLATAGSIAATAIAAVLRQSVQSLPLDRT